MRKDRWHSLSHVSTAAALEAAPARATTVAAGGGEAGSRAAAPGKTEGEAVPQPAAAAAAEVAAGAGRLADSDAAAAVSGEGGCRRGVRPVVGLLSGLKGRPDLLEPDLCCDVLHLTDEPG